MQKILAVLDLLALSCVLAAALACASGTGRTERSGAGPAAAAPAPVAGASAATAATAPAPSPPAAASTATPAAAIAGASTPATAVATPTPAAASPIRDADLGLAKGSVFEVQSPPAVAWEASDPGDRPKAPRAYDGAPPVIPHGIADFLPITRDNNACLGCHAPGPDAAESVPPSHLIDYRHDPEHQQPQVVGARFYCTACHVPRSNAPALVGTSFRSP